MYQIQDEILDQFSALIKTNNHILSKEKEIIDYFSEAKKVIILGAGSSFSLAKSFAAQLMMMGGYLAFAVAAGDYLVNSSAYRKLINNAFLITISRSGTTTEIIRALNLAKRQGAKKNLSLCALKDAEISDISDINIELPWCFDKAICQTRTVTNFYAAGLMISAILAKDANVKNALLSAPRFFNDFREVADEHLRRIANVQWERAVVLADAGVAGLAEEGALAFKEICRHQSNFYHVLDIRHGPIVLIDEKTLVLHFVTSENQKLQQDLGRDIKRKGAKYVAMDCNQNSVMDIADELFILPQVGDDKVAAIYMMYCIHMITYVKALNNHVNPEEPAGLTAWITLEDK